MYGTVTDREIHVADTLIGNLTVTEMLRYTSEMKNPTTMPLAEKHAKVRLPLCLLAIAMSTFIVQDYCTLHTSRLLYTCPDASRYISLSICYAGQSCD